MVIFAALHCTQCKVRATGINRCICVEVWKTVLQGEILTINTNNDGLHSASSQEVTKFPPHEEITLTTTSAPFRGSEKATTPACLHLVKFPALTQKRISLTGDKPTNQLPVGHQLVRLRTPWRACGSTHGSPFSRSFCF